MVYAAVCFAALVASALTFVSGFGLGTLLLPAFLFFFPIELAVAATACVHLANNLFKLALVGRHSNSNIIIRFGLAATAFAVLGALAQHALETLPPLHTWHLAGVERSVTWIKLAVGLVILAFAFLELSPRYDSLAFDRKYLPLGGALSGFFGGLSGHQGALRSAFLVRCNLSKESLVATGVVIAVMVDVARLSIYWKDTADHFLASRALVGPVLAGTAAAFTGSFLGSRLLKKITLRAVRLFVGAGLLLFGALLASGIV